MEPDLNDLVNDALTRWVAITGVTLDQTRFTIGRGIDTLALHGILKSLNESRDLDPTGLTTAMLLRDNVRVFAGECRATFWALMEDPAAVAEQVRPLRELWEIVDSPTVVGGIEAYRRVVLDQCAHYGVEPDEDFLEWLDDEGLAVLRRDALRSMKTLQLHQFTQGESDPTPLGYNPQVVEFWNMNSLLAALRSQRLPGITMVLIRDPEVLHSFFCFAVRDGATITILTDAPKVPHPDYKHMARRPDRNLSKRAEQHWFPYELLGIEVSEDQKRLYATARTSLVPLHAEAVPLKALRELSPATVIWATLMFDLIRQRLQVEGLKAPALSYTGEMVRSPHSLVGEHSALVRAGLYEPLVVAPIGSADLKAGVTESADFREPVGHNQWMVDRYGGEVPEVALNPVGPSEVAAMLPTIETGALAPLKVGWNREERLQIAAFDPTSFGTREAIERDRMWTARKNQATVIQRLADDEFIREREGVERWYAERVLANADALLNAAARGELHAPHFHARQFGGHGPIRDSYPDEASYQSARERHEREITAHHRTANILSQHAGDGPGWRVSLNNEVALAEGTIWLRSKHRGWESIDGTAHEYPQRCFDRPAVRATITSTICPTCPEAIALVCGVTVDELPWPLRHWYTERPYTGNSILDRVDHIDELRNPWAPWGRGAPNREGYILPALSLQIMVLSSKNALNVRRKALGLPRATWGAGKVQEDE